MGSAICKKGLNEEDLDMFHKLSKKPVEEIIFWHEHFVKGIFTRLIQKKCTIKPSHWHSKIKFEAF